jgi:CheY-like chemotaxis protein
MQNKTILVIEDNELNMKLVKGLLPLGEYDIHEAADAETGVELARQLLPDLILMDIQLPGMDGLAATRLMKEDSAVKDIPVVALTSYAMQGDEDRAIQSGCAGYISKPIDTRSFIATIARYLAPNGH